MYTIQDLTDGKVAVINDGTLEELKIVLKAAFPNDSYKIHGACKYYIKSEYHNSWKPLDIIIEPTQSVKDFIKLMNTPDYSIAGTKLPVIPKGTQFRVKGWPVNASNNILTQNLSDYVSCGTTIFKSEIYIIAEREYQSHVVSMMFKLSDIQKLNQSTMEKKIIGYKLIKPEYANVSANIVGWNHPMYKLEKVTDQEYIKKLQKAGVLDLWFEPVYEQLFKEGDSIIFLKSFDGVDAGHIAKITIIRKDGAHHPDSVWLSYSPNQHGGGGFKVLPSQDNGYVYGVDFRLATPEEIEKSKIKIFTMTVRGGSFELEVSSKGIFYRPENAYIDLSFLQQFEDLKIARNENDGDNKPYKVSVTRINVGCKTDCLVQEWKDVFDYYKSVKP